MKRGILFALLVAAFATSVFAGLGETEDQVNARYGECVTKIENAPNLGRVYTYKHKNFYVIVIFADGKSQSEWYVHQDGTSRLSPAEIQELLEMNSLGGVWQKNPERPMWSLSDLKAFAVYSAGLNLPGFGVCTSEYADLFHERKWSRHVL